MNPLGLNKLALRKPRTDVSKLSIRSIMRMSDDDCRKLFAEIRWPGGHPVCPKCQIQAVYWLKSRSRYKCQACSHQFSVTSGTLFANRKLPLSDYLCAIVIFVQAAKGISSCQLSRNLEISQKSAFVILHKLREALEVSIQQLQLSGVVEIDGATFGGYRRYFNHAEQKFEKRRFVSKNDNKHVVVIARARFGRSVPFVGQKESDALPAIQKVIKRGSVIAADEGSAWNGLKRLFDMVRIKHAVSFSTNYACTNMAESYFSLLRRMHLGVHHRISKRNMGAYASELCWKQDFREEDNDLKIRMLLMLSLNSGPSPKWSKYWQRRAAVKKAA